VQYAAKRTGAEHPCEKPLGVMRWLVERVTIDRHTTILDPFAGSGSTGVAAIQTGRRFLGIEINEEYFNVMVKRIKEALLQTRMDI
jgi:site-specific DNA-methyltransferase (adenine-specific)